MSLFHEGISLSRHEAHSIGLKVCGDGSVLNKTAVLLTWGSQIVREMGAFLLLPVS